MQYIEIGPVPGEENCAQVGSPDYTEASLRECKVLRRMLDRLFPVPEGLPVAYVSRTHPHDFGSYREVCIRFDEANRQAVAFAYAVERAVPAAWDATARFELAWYERKRAYELAVRELRLQPEDAPAHYGAVAPPSLPPGFRFAELLASNPQKSRIL